MEVHASIEPTLPILQASYWYNSSSIIARIGFKGKVHASIYPTLSYPTHLAGAGLGLSADEAGALEDDAAAELPTAAGRDVREVEAVCPAGLLRNTSSKAEVFFRTMEREFKHKKDYNIAVVYLV